MQLLVSKKTCSGSLVCAPPPFAPHIKAGLSTDGRGYAGLLSQRAHMGSDIRTDRLHCETTTINTAPFLTRSSTSTIETLNPASEPVSATETPI